MSKTKTYAQTRRAETPERRAAIDTAKAALLAQRETCPDCGRPRGLGSREFDYPGPCARCDRAAQGHCPDDCSDWGGDHEPHGAA